MGIQRYRVSCAAMGVSERIPSPIGDVVLFADHLEQMGHGEEMYVAMRNRAAKSEEIIAKLEAQIERMREIVKKYRYGHDIDGEYRFHDECRIHATTDNRCSLCKETDAALERE